MRLHGGNENVDKDRFISIMSNYVKTRQSAEICLKTEWKLV